MRTTTIAVGVSLLSLARSASSLSSPTTPAPSLPRLAPLADAKAFAAAHSFSKTANWLIPGRVLCGHYPGACPSRPASDDEVRTRLQEVRDAGVCTFVCLQDEIPAQEEIWPEGGVVKKSERAPWATGNFQNYRRLMPMEGCHEQCLEEASYVHYKLPDLSVAKTLNDLDVIVSDCVSRTRAGSTLYLHCWGGRGRTGMIAACVLGALYPELDADAALDRVQTAYALREPWRQDGKRSPETEEQRSQVRDWFSYKREAKVSLIDARPGLRDYGRDVWGIWDRKGTRLLEVVSPGADGMSGFRVGGSESDADKLGNGQFGQVFRGRCERSLDHDPVAIKVNYNLEDAPTHHQSRLALEATVLRAMSGTKGFPKVLYDARQTIFGKRGDVLVMQLLGRPLLKRVWDQSIGDRLCKDKHFTEEAVLKIGRDILTCLRSLHEAGYTHNDLKPNNMLFGAQGSGTEDDVHLVDFGMVTPIGVAQDAVVEGTTLQAGGASPLFASVAQLDGRPTRPVDDVESLWYILAFLVQDDLPWQWEPSDRLANIKRRLFEDACGVLSDNCEAQLKAEDCCSTKHCLNTFEDWNVPDSLHELWAYVLDGNDDEDRDGAVDYDGCMEALGGASEREELSECLTLL